MDTYDTASSDEHPMLGRLIKLGLFLLVQGIAVMLVAFVALLVSLEPGWSATTEQASLLQPGDARSGSLLLKDDGATTEAIRLGIDVDITVSGPTLRARVTQTLPQPDSGLGRGNLCLSARDWRHRRYAEDGGR